LYWDGKNNGIQTLTLFQGKKEAAVTKSIRPDSMVVTLIIFHYKAMILCVLIYLTSLRFFPGAKQVLICVSV
jgi:hypothetical protein